MLWPFYFCSPKMPWLMPCKQPGMTVISCGSSMRRSKKPRRSCSGLSLREMQKWHSGEQSMRLMPYRELRSWKMPSKWVLWVSSAPQLEGLYYLHLHVSNLQDLPPLPVHFLHLASLLYFFGDPSFISRASSRCCDYQTLFSQSSLWTKAPRHEPTPYQWSSLWVTEFSMWNFDLDQVLSKFTISTYWLPLANNDRLLFDRSKVQFQTFTHTYTHAQNYLPLLSIHNLDAILCLS